MARRILALGGLILLATLGLAADSEAPARTDSAGDPLPRGAIARIGNLRLVQGGSVSGLAFSRDGKMLYSSSDGMPLRAWETSTGKEMAVPSGWSGPCSALALAPGGKLLAAAGETTIRVVDLETGRARAIGLDQAMCQDLAFAPDGKLLAWVDEMRKVHLYDLTTGKTIRVLQTMTVRKPMGPGMGPADEPIGVEPMGNTPPPAFSPDGKLLASVVQNGQVMLWETGSGKRLRAYQAISPEEGGPAGCLNLSFSSDGKSLRVVTQMGKLRLWDTDSLEEKETPEAGTEPVSTVAISPDGKTLAVCNFEGKVDLLEAATGKVTGNLQVEEMSTCLALSQDGKLLAQGTGQGFIRLWDVATGKELLAGTPRRSFLTAMLTDRGKKIVAVSTKGVSEWTLPRGEMRHEHLFAEGKVQHALVSPDGRHALVLTEEMQTRLIETATGKAREGAREQMQFSGLVAAFSPRGDLLALYDGNDQRNVKLFDPATGKEKRALKREGQPTPNGALAFSPDGRTLLVGGWHPTSLARYELSTGQLRQPARIQRSRSGMDAIPGGGPQLPGILVPPGVAAPNGGMEDQMQAIRIVAVAPDCRHLALARGNRIVLIVMATGKVVRTFEGADQPVTSVAFSPDGRWLTASGMDAVVRIWDARTGELRSSLEGHRGPINAANFSTDGTRLVTSSTDGTLLVWDVAEALKRPAAPAPVVREVRPFEEVWRELGAEDPAIAERGIFGVADASSAFIERLRKEIKPIPKLEEGMLTRLIGELDSNEATVRDTATKKLEELEDLAGPALRAAQKNPSAEVRRRVGRLLERLERTQLNGNEARALRVIEGLELSGSAAARKLLEELAAGAPEARITREATAAANRLKGRAEEH
ncbi:MAG: hypothetical protein U0840_22545 [Gemmataceae bacterium]